MLGGIGPPVPVHAEPVQPQIATMCVEPWRPYLGIDETGKLAGPALDLIDTAFNRIGVKTRYIIQSDTRCDILIDAGRATGRFPVDADEENILLSSQPFALWRIVALVRQNSNHQGFSGLEQFDGDTILNVRDHFYPEPIYSWMQRQRQVDVVSAYGPSVMKLLKYGRIDVFFDDETWLKLELRYHDHGLKILSPPVATVPQFLGVAPQHPQLHDALNRILDQMAADGSISTIFSEALGPRAAILDVVRKDYPAR